MQTISFTRVAELSQGERMIPIIFVSIPTIIGAAMLVGLQNSSEKGALLFASWLIGKF